MTDHPNLFDVAPVAEPIHVGRILRDEAPPLADGTHGEMGLRERFEVFHADNPHVLDELVELARQVRRRGITRYGIATLFEVLRYKHSLRTDDPTSEFKLNNSYRSYYARLVLEVAPDLGEGFFELRRQRSAARKAA